ncbi:hypothetical protein CPB84DRAFT_1751009 [Gymnopilus junonius]|uniref:Uncharacterized protein n=1 Tax=Gymnopilus junonius TaxID=109634 RepID=A0A9P5TJC4_GYMJU|nr:hypothetical protein CPB84DRAFT_1751009 [Gymnopilus junonius]
MAPVTRLILDFNRWLAPNPFNTGPPIPQLSQPFGTEDTPWTTSTFRAVESDSQRSDTSTPDLTNSPSSTVSSLEDEGIRRIFSPSRYQGFDGADVPGCSNTAPQHPRKDELNPHAVPFVPSFITYSGIHNPISNWVDPSLSYAPPPLELGVQLFNLVDPPLEDPEQTPVFEDSPHPETISQLPLDPPGIPYPPIYSTPQPRPEGPTPECPPPQYLPVLLDALKPGRTSREREVLAGVIVNIVDDWNIDSLLELAERVAMEASNPTLHATLDTMEIREIPRTPFQNSLMIYSIEAAEEPTHETKVAELAAGLNMHFNRHHREVGQFFTWNLREIVLTRLINFWDYEKPQAITLASNQPLIMFNPHSHVLMKKLESVEHVEALAHLVLGCGPTFWKPVDVGSGPSLANPPANPCTVPENTMVLQHDDLDSEKLQMHVKENINLFLTGLEANLLGRRLKDEDSVVGQPWERGRLLKTIQEIVDVVKYRESIILTGR